MTTSQKIDEVVERAKDKTLFFCTDFPDYNQDYVQDRLSIYVREGVLLRLANGIYLKTAITRFGPVYPTPSEIAEAIARRDHAQVLISGAAAENYFGLSTQIPMKIVYVTSGSARKLTVGNTAIEFKRGVPKNFAFKDKTIATLCMALKSIGNDKVTKDQTIVLKAFLKEYTEKHDITNDVKLMPKWMQKLINDLIIELKND